MTYGDFIGDPQEAPEWLAKGQIVYEDPARVLAVYNGDVWYSDPWVPDGVRIRPQSRGQNLEADMLVRLARILARLEIAVSVDSERSGSDTVITS